jgi:hypothetical protein
MATDEAVDNIMLAPMPTLPVLEMLETALGKKNRVSAPICISSEMTTPSYARVVLSKPWTARVESEAGRPGSVRSACTR